MRVAFSGTRNLYARPVLGPIIFALPKDTEVLHGASGAVDWEVDRLARLRGLRVSRYPANWERHGRAAGPIRNLEMIGAADHAVLIWDGKSPGTSGCYSLAKRRGLPYSCYVGRRLGLVLLPDRRFLVYCEWRLHDGKAM